MRPVQRECHGLRASEAIEKNDSVPDVKVKAVNDHLKCNGNAQFVKNSKFVWQVLTFFGLLKASIDGHHVLANLDLMLMKKSPVTIC